MLQEKNKQLTDILEASGEIHQLSTMAGSGSYQVNRREDFSQHHMFGNGTEEEGTGGDRGYTNVQQQRNQDYGFNSEEGDNAQVVRGMNENIESNHQTNEERIFPDPVSGGPPINFDDEIDGEEDEEEDDEDYEDDEGGIDDDEYEEGNQFECEGGLNAQASQVAQSLRPEQQQ